MNNKPKLIELVISDIKRYKFYQTNTLYKIIKIVYLFLFDIEFKATLNYRLSHFFYQNKFTKIFSLILWNKSKVKYNVDIHPGCKIGKGIKLVHVGAIVIGRTAIIGENVSIQSCVTIGEKNLIQKEMPIIGNNVYIGTGAKILGKAIIGENVIIGANSVLINNVDSNTIVGGIPATLLKRA